MILFKNKQGISLIELIVVMAVLLVLAAAVFVWIDPLAKIGSAKNKKRIEAVNILAAAITNYSNEHKGVLPVLGSVTTDKKVLCSSQGGSTLSCAGDEQLCLTVDDDFVKYLAVLPYDPDKSSAADTGYYLEKDTNNKLVVGSCTSYDSLSITKKLGLKVSCAAYGGGYCWYLGGTVNQSCNTVCTTNNLTCVKNVMYGPDKKSDGTAFCQLNKNLDITCDTCTVAVTSTPPYYVGTSCYIQTGAVGCSTLAGALNYPICPCN